MSDKLKRLDRILGGCNIVHDHQRHYSVETFFVLMSRKGSPKKAPTDWPGCALRDGSPVWIEMKTSHEGYVTKAVQCDEKGRECDGGGFWKAKDEKI